MSRFTFELGTLVTDRATGFTGVVTGRAEYLDSKNLRYGVTPKSVDNAAVDDTWFDEGRLVSGKID